MTPSTNNAHAGTFSLTFSASDGVAVATSSASSFTLQFDVGGSFKFDGNGDAVTVPASADFSFGTGDFTLEYWAYWNSHSDYQTLFSTRRTSGGFSTGTDASGDMVWYDTNGTSSRKLEVVGAVPLKQWTHQAFSRINGIMYGWQDGVLKGKGTVSANYTTTESSIGVLDSGSGADGEWADVHLDSVRSTKGKALYTPNFTPYGGQKNVVHDRGGAVTDARLASANTHAIQMGRAAIGSDVATNANTYCLAFDGTDDYLVHHTGSGTGTTQFRSNDDRGTIFAWIYPDVVNSHGGIFSAGYTGDTHTYFDFYLSSGAKLGMQQKENNTNDGVTGDTS